ncbi:MAG: hypothetical protein LBU27_03200 [Candidatus Peribacteria bacterium]|nr:hypothetical protein [Candidatus Peribacteria bacterium]
MMSYQYAKDKNAVYCLGDTYPEAKKIP